MPNSELEELMRLYAVRGVIDWNDTDGEVCRKIRNCLSISGIVEKEQLIRRTMEKSKRSGDNASQHFFPMPDTFRKSKNGSSSRPRVSLFAPRYPDGMHSHMAFDLVSFVSFMDHQHCLAFRFEPADEPHSSHGYPHVQLSRRLSRRTVPVDCIPSWLPDSYPAFPVSARDSTEMFLSMAVAVHGFGGGVKRLIEEMFRERPLLVRKYVEKLEDFLRISQSTRESSPETSGSNGRNRP